MENPHVLEDIEEIVHEEGIIERKLKQWNGTFIHNSTNMLGKEYCSFDG